MNTTHLKTAIDESAAVAAFQQEAALSKVRRAKEEWKKLFEQFEHLTQRVLGCRDALNYGKERAEFRRNHFNGYCGATHTTNLNFLRAASEIGAIVGAIPILQDALSHNEKLLAEHKRKDGALRSPIRHRGGSSHAIRSRGRHHCRRPSSVRFS